MRKRQQDVADATMTSIRELESYWGTFDALREKRELDVLSERPPGGVTAREYGERYGLNEETSFSHLRKLEASGDVKRVYVRLPDKRGHQSRIAVFVPCAAS